jgi:hypothetical protein
VSGGTLPALIDTHRLGLARPSVQNDFVRGLVSAGLLAAVQNRPGRAAADRRTMRLALQGGTSLAAGCAAARAWQKGNAGGALVAVTIGAVGVVAIEHLLHDETAKENSHE